MSQLPYAIAAGVGQCFDGKELGMTWEPDYLARAVPGWRKVKE